MTVEEDGTFTGEYRDDNAFETYICDFTGEFSNLQKIDEYTYSMQVGSIEYARNINEEYQEDSITYIVSVPIGFEKTGEFMLYLPGRSTEDLPQGFLDWVWIAGDVSEKLPFYGIYNTELECGFFSDTGEPVDEDNTGYDAITMQHVISINATSELVEKKVVHSKERLIDGDLKKAWVEGAAGQGIGESVWLYFDDTYKISGLSINAGYQKSKDLYEKNSRPKQITVDFSDGSSQILELEDKYDTQVKFFDVPIDSEYVKITIDSVYEGTKYTDTCISELLLF